jgi:hypothetical protein
MTDRVDGMGERHLLMSALRFYPRVVGMSR